VITNRDGKAHIRVINSSETDKEIVIPHITLQEIDEISNSGQQNSSWITEINLIQQAEDKTKLTERVQELLRLKHLNSEEIAHVMNLLSKHNDFFQLLSEELSSTAIEHRINSTDNQYIQNSIGSCPRIKLK